MYKKITLLLFFIISLSSCLSSESEITLNSDMSGNIKTSLTVNSGLQAIYPVDLLSRPSKDRLEIFENSNLKFINYKCNTTIKVASCEYNFTFKNIEDIDIYTGYNETNNSETNNFESQNISKNTSQSIPQDTSQNNTSSDIRIAKVLKNGNDTTIEARYSPKQDISLLPKELNDLDLKHYTLAQKLTQDILKNYSVSFVLNTPSQIKNATGGVQFSKNRASYKITLDKLVSQDSEIVLKVVF